MTVSEAFKAHSEGGQPPALARAPLVWLSALCLDAPLVAVVWQQLFAKALHVRLERSVVAALFLTAWWIYLADRLADSLTLKPAAPVALRTAFARDHRSLFFGLLTAVALADAFVILSNLDFALIRDGALLGLMAVGYLFLNHRFQRLWRSLPLKELIIGFLFAGGTTLVFFGVTPAKAFVAAVFLFACVCSLNCLSIAFWERNIDLGQGKHSYATEHSGGSHLVRLWCVLMAVISCALGAYSISRPLAASLAVSGSLLLLLHFVDVRQDERTALADLALLLPALIFLLPGLW